MIRLLLLALIAATSSRAQVPLGPFATDLREPIDIVQLQDGRVLVSLPRENEIRAFSPEGDDLGAFAKVQGSSGPWRLVQLSNGRVLATVRQRIEAFDSDGVALGTFAEGFENPGAMIQLTDGRVLVAEEGFNTFGRVTVLSSEGAFLRRFARRLANPIDLVQLADGRILVVEADEVEVEAFDAEGTPLGLFAEGNTLEGVAQLQDGRVLLTNEMVGAVGVIAFSPEGKALGQFVSGLSYPKHLAQLQDGRLLVVERFSEGGGLGGVQAFGVVPVASEPELESDAVVSAMWPSPVRAGATVRLMVTLGVPGRAEVAVVDALGREVRRHEVVLGAGEQTVEVATAGLAPGAYAVRVEGPGVRAVRRLVVMR